MAFKSEAQRKKFQSLHREGKISKEVLDAFESETGDKKLPDRVKKTKKEKALPTKAWFAKVTK